MNILKYKKVDHYHDIVEIPDWLFREKQVRGFAKPLHLKTFLKN